MVNGKKGPGEALKKQVPPKKKKARDTKQKPPVDKVREEGKVRMDKNPFAAHKKMGPPLRGGRPPEREEESRITPKKGSKILIPQKKKHAGMV